MEWTRELRYKPYADWGAKTLLDLQAQAAGSDYKLGYHIMPTSGLINGRTVFHIIMDIGTYSTNHILLDRFMV